MIRYHQTDCNSIIAEVTDKSFVINDTQDVLDLIAEIGMNDCNKLIINESNLNPIFFDLKTGLAGEILQKFSNYRSRLAIVGDFSKFSSKSLQDFIRECNRGKMILFTDSTENALEKL